MSQATIESCPSVIDKTKDEYHWCSKLGNGNIINKFPSQMKMTNFIQFPVPKEIVVKNPSDIANITFDYGRIYYRETGAEFKKTTYHNDGFEGVSCIRPRIYLAEIWQDFGDDGHVSYMFVNQYYIIKETDHHPIDPLTMIGDYLQR